MTAFRCITADSPWLERGGGKSKRGADGHYPLMNKKDIRATILESNMFHPAPSCHLWLWATSNFLHDALWVMETLAFQYVTNAVWVKVNEDFPRLTFWTDIDGNEWSVCEHGAEHSRVCRECALKLTLPDVEEVLNEALQIGLGQYMRHAHEWLLLGTRGKAMVPETKDRMQSVIFAPRTTHSTKPQEAYDMIERVSPGPRLEFFARQSRDGWTVFGNEV
ncbi:MAG: MT-A70 family methyltransferase [Planctomycetota bacterium]